MQADGPCWAVEPMAERDWGAAWAGIWPMASPSLAQKIGWRLWEGRSDPIHPAWLLEQGWSGYKLVGSAHGANFRLQPPPSTLGF